ncbi:MAG: hypothetical protein GC161_04650 [Planctomycetaceae bacterium]|nr:hypothetical protein [Planctomycetaceae bacterium]
MGERSGKVNGKFLGFLALFGGLAAAMAVWAAKPQRDVVSSHHPGGTNLAVRPFEKGRPARAWVTWYEDRWKASESYFEGGRRVGEWHQFGRPYRGTDGEGTQAELLSAAFESDELHGAFARSHPGGEPREAGTYVRGLRHGEWVERATPGAAPRSRHYWRGHDLGVDSKALFDALETDPPADFAGLELRIGAAD